VTSKDRSPVAPDVPTIAESGYPASMRSPGTASWRRPNAARDRQKLNDEFVKALRDPETKALLEKQCDAGGGQFA